MTDTIDAARHLSAGRFRPLVDRELSLEELGDAHRLMDEGQLIGKAIIRP
jgi:NADPH:quinone reductase-like Zn-dependent oxidoreductase